MMRDEVRLILSWLDGNVKGGASEKKARRLLADMLRAGRLTMGTRLLLASRIDPGPSDDVRFILARRRGRKKIVDERNIAAFIWRAVKGGATVPAAVDAVDEALGVKRAAALKAWAIWRPIFERDAHKLKGLTRVEE